MGLHGVGAVERIATRAASVLVRPGATLNRCDRGATEDTVLAVLDDGDHVEHDLCSGVLRCPSCGGQLRPWGWARVRELRAPRSRMLRPRRTRCRACAATHVLVPICALLRRRDNIEVIGAALVAKHAGQGHRRIGANLGVPASTVRGWLRRFTQGAEGLRTLNTVMALDLDPMHPAIQPRGSPVRRRSNAPAATANVVTATSSIL